MNQAVELIKAEIARLQSALAILQPVKRGRPPKNPLANVVPLTAPKRRGRPPGSKNKRKEAA